jgi:predicted nuclease with TOPRIM domain
MDRTEFRAAVESLDPDDEEGLITAVQQRVRALSSRHVDIQEQIDESESTRQNLERRLQEAEAEIIEQANASVEADVGSVDDIESLPEDVSVEFDPELLAEVREIRQQARSNYQQTAEEGADLQAELSDNSDELELHQDVLADLEAGDATVSEARERLLDALDEGAD